MQVFGVPILPRLRTVSNYQYIRSYAAMLFHTSVEREEYLLSLQGC